MNIITQKEHLARLAAIRERYPTQFADIEPVRLDVSPGWWAIIEAMCREVEEAIPADLQGKFQWLQIKEKYGTLRAYWSGGPLVADLIAPGVRIRMDTLSRKQCLPPGVAEHVRAAVERAEAASAVTCNFCGAPGALTRNGGWLVTACQEHQTTRLRDVWPD